MIEINSRQRDFYEEVRQQKNFAHGNRSLMSKIWSSVRNRLWAYQKDVDMRRVAANLHREHLGSLPELDVLDLGSGTGSDLSMHLAGNAKSYLGIDLAQSAVDGMNKELEKRGFHNAKAIRGDILDSSLPNESFDVIYAAAVLHHFKHIDVIADELNRLLKPGGVILSYDPLGTEPLNALARKIYRRQQDDKDWEWPFGRDEINTLSNTFDLVALQGALGFSKLGLPFYFIPGITSIARIIARWGMKMDEKFATSPGPGLWICWQLAMVLRKREDT